MPQCRMPQYRKATVQKDTVQNGRSAEMGNVLIVLSSRVTEWHDVTTRNNQLNKQLKDVTYNENTILFRSYYYELLFRITNYANNILF